MTQPKVVAWRPMYDPVGHALFREAGAELVIVDSTDPGDVKAELGEARALWVRTPERVSADVMDAAPSLAVISTSGFGTDNIDIPAATERGILVVNNLGFGRKPVSEHTVMLLLAVMNLLVCADRATRDGSGWTARSGFDFQQLEGRTVGLVGLGYIGSELARKLRLGFRCRVLAHDPHADPRLAPAVDAERVADLDEMLKQTSVLCLCAELTSETRSMISKRELALLPEGAIVVNTARGPILDLDALSQALASGHLFGAGLDVTDPEPLAKDHPLYNRENVIFTPHTAGLTVETAEAQTRFSVDQVMTLLRGGAPTFPVNPQAWESPASRRPKAE